MQIALLNTTILTSFGQFSLEPLTIEEARNLVQGSEVVSHVGHQAACDAMSTLLSVPVPMNRAPFTQAVGQVAVCLKVKGRLEEGRILNLDELSAIGFDLMKLTKTA